MWELETALMWLFPHPQSPYIDHVGLGIMNRWIYKHVPLCFAYLHDIYYLHDICKDPVSKLVHILRFWVDSNF